MYSSNQQMTVSYSLIVLYRMFAQKSALSILDNADFILSHKGCAKKERERLENRGITQGTLAGGGKILSEST